ncbi:MAG: PIN domain-containing protein [Acidobacteriota bacterium]|nr:PIN domain-containing protein [Acidobacteriota bacterium]
MIVVDTSVWIFALRSASGPEATTLRSLLDADEVALAVPVRTELLMGARASDRVKLEKELKGLPLLYPTDESWRTIDRWTDRASRAGVSFAIGDLLIGVLAADIGGLVWSLDSDFDRMEKLKLVDRFTGPKT